MGYNPDEDRMISLCDIDRRLQRFRTRARALVDSLTPKEKAMLRMRFETMPPVGRDTLRAVDTYCKDIDRKAVRK